MRIRSPAFCALFLVAVLAALISGDRILQNPLFARVGELMAPDDAPQFPKD
ncbi:hypothetical protein G3I16_14075 [Streptomyces sp. SID11726]|nr:hypothetical protein [Streptomyces sp. SID11726]